MEATGGGLKELARRYAEEWNNHDIDAIMCVHTSDTERQAHGPARK